MPPSCGSAEVDSSQETDNAGQEQDTTSVPTLENELIGIRSAMDTDSKEIPARKKLIISKRKKELAGVAGTNFSS